MVPPSHLPALTVAVILPILNEAAHLDETLSALLELHNFDEVIVVDGGSTDTSVEIVCKFMSSGEPDSHAVPILIQSPCGRARQMQMGAQATEADVLLFLHADSTLPPGAADDIRDAINEGHSWGRFDVRLSGRHILFRAVERLMNWRSRLTGVATGDQAIFVQRDVYRMLGGYAPLALMEDIEFSTRLKWVGKPAYLSGPVIASSRRWEENGIVRTILLMWTLRFLCWLGVSPDRLARWYYRRP
ncbi:MAG: TIGR04283 family arsenosugar biosynthesis glycosyltransferase [Sulfuricaulis sp.]